VDLLVNRSRAVREGYPIVSLEEHHQRTFENMNTQDSYRRNGHALALSVTVCAMVYISVIAAFPSSPLGVLIYVSFSLPTSASGNIVLPL